MSGWTPGPWEVDHHEDTWFVPTIQGQTTEANARLIAAAPEMAELLGWLADEAESLSLGAHSDRCGNDHDYKDCQASEVQAARDLLARIKGGSA